MLRTALGAFAGVGAAAYLYQNDKLAPYLQPYPGADAFVFSAASKIGSVLRSVDGETAHVATVKLGALGLLPRDHRPDPPSLCVHVWGRKFTNPLGLAAGFDKNGESVDALLLMGFGMVEIGSVTPQPQLGNPKPRVFRLAEAEAVINRYGFNSEGVEAVGQRLAARAQSQGGSKGGALGINLGKNKHTEDAAEDYVRGVRALAQYADYLVINISSPNTPGLRALQSKQSLVELVSRVRAARDDMRWGEAGPPPILVKIAPDLTEADKQDIASVALAHKVDGLIVSNTTIQRPAQVLQLEGGSEPGGLSGKPLFAPSTAVLSDMYKLTKGRVPLVGCGGVSNGREAYQKIRAGASLVQVYTALVYQGAELVPSIKKELAECLAADGFANVSEAVGVDHRVQSRSWWFF